MPLDQQNMSEIPDDVSEDDWLTNKYVSPELREHEVELFRTKWWDYRFISPVEATFAFISAYGKEARKIYAREIDYEKAEFFNVGNVAAIRKGLLENSSKAKRFFTGFWRARQVADALGMMYEDYISLILNSRMRRWGDISVKDSKGRDRVKFPTANQLYGENDVERVQARWEEMQASRIYTASHHAYMTQNFMRLPAQIAYQEHLLSRAKRSPKYLEILTDMIRDDRLSVELVLENLNSSDGEKILATL